MFRQFRALFIILTLVFLLMVGPASAESGPIAGVTGEGSTQVSCALLDSMLGGAGISLQGFNLSEQSFNLSEQSFNLSEQSFNLSEQSFNLSEQGFNLSEQGFNLSEQSFNLSEQGFNLAEQTFNLSEQAFNLSEQGFTVSEQGFNLSEQGFNISEQAFNISEQTGETTTFTWYSPVFQWTGVSGTAQILMDYSNPENVGAEVALHTVPTEYDEANNPKYTWGGDLVSSVGLTTTPNSLHGTNKVAVIFVDVGEVTDPSSHMSKVVNIFNGLYNSANIPNLELVYINISDEAINYRVSRDRDEFGNVIPGGYIGIEGALEQAISGAGYIDENDMAHANLLEQGYSNIVINMSLAFIPCADMITTPSGYTFEFDIDDFIQEYNNSTDPDYVPPQEEVAVKPIAECVYTDGKNWYARFGYENNNTHPVILDAGGNKNRFNPSPQYRDQPSIFETGRHRGVIEIRFSKPSITWELIDQFGDVRSATAYIPGEEPEGFIRDPYNVETSDTATDCFEFVDEGYPENDPEAWKTPIGIDPTTGLLPAPDQPIQPILECIRYDEFGNNPVAVFGYKNFNKRTVYVPSGGKDNKFKPNPGNRGQVTHFLPGRQPSVFEVPFKDNEQNISWTLDSNWYDGVIDFDTTIVAEAYPAEPTACADTENVVTDLGNYLSTFANVPEGEVLNVLAYLLSVETVDDDTDTDGLKSLLAEYLVGSQEQPSDYNIAVVASSGNYRPWFNVMLGIGNISIYDDADGNQVVHFEDEVIPPLSPARWHETIAISASLGKDAWALLDDDNDNAELLDAENEIFAARTIPEDGNGIVELWEDICYNSAQNDSISGCEGLDGEDEIFQWLLWFFSHDGDIMARGAGYNIGTQESPNIIAGTSFASPGAAYVLAQYFSFPDACTFVDPDTGVVQPPVARDYPTGWANRILEESYANADAVFGTPYWCEIQTNEPPVADDAEFSTPEDTQLPENPETESVAVSATDPDDDALTYELKTDVANGTLEFNSDGTFVYMPDENYNGPDSFTFVAKDSYSTSNVGTVTITVTPVNDAPVANDDNYSIGEDNLLEVVAPGVLGNDTEVDGDTLIVKINYPDNPYLESGELIIATANGMVTIHSDGSFYYTPNADYFGPDSFTYQVCDVTDVLPVTSPCPTATVNITVTPENDAPVANDDSYDVDEDEVLSVAAPGVLGNDTDVDGDPLIVTSNTTPANGTLILNADGSFSYDSDENFNGEDSFTYQVCDVTSVLPTTSPCPTATVTITVNPTNDAPDAVDDYALTDEDTPVDIDVLSNDTDIDGDVLTVSSASNGSNGTVTVAADGSYVSYAPNANFNSSDSFTYTISDGYGGTDTATVFVTIAAVNDAPDAVDDYAATTDKAAITINVLANDTDVDGDGLIVVGVSQPVFGSVVNNENGTVTYTPIENVLAVQTVVTFTYTISDLKGGIDTATVYVTVDPVNDAPIAYDQLDLSTVATIPLDITLMAFDPDGGALSYEIVGPTSGTLTGTAPYLTFVGDEDASFTFRAFDGQAHSNTATVMIDVLALCESEPIAEIVISPPNNKYHMITLDLSELPSGLAITGIRQDEPVDKFEPDAIFEGDGFDGSNALIRAQRDGKGDGRVYTIILTNGGECAYLAYVYVDHDARNNGAKHDSTKPGN